MFHQLCLEQKRCTKLWLGPSIMWIIINDPRIIEKVLLSPECLEKPFFYKFLRLGNGLITAKCMLRFLTQNIFIILEFGARENQLDSKIFKRKMW